MFGYIFCFFSNKSNLYSKKLKLRSGKQYKNFENLCPNTSSNLQMVRDGNLVLHADGRKCRATTYGMADEWKN